MSETNVGSIETVPVSVPETRSTAVERALRERPVKKEESVSKASEEKVEREEANVQSLAYEDVKALTEELNDIVKGMHNEIRFTIQGDNGELVVQVIDRETDEVIRQIPPEDLLDVREKFNEALGIIFDEER